MEHTIVWPSCTSFRSVSMTHSAWNASNPVVDSLAKITDGLAMSSHAIDRRFFSPPMMPRALASPTIVSAHVTNPSRYNNSYTYRSRAFTFHVFGN